MRGGGYLPRELITLEEVVAPLSLSFDAPFDSTIRTRFVLAAFQQSSHNLLIISFRCQEYIEALLYPHNTTIIPRYFESSSIMSTYTTAINYPSVPQHCQPNDVKLCHRRRRCTVRLSETSQLALFDSTTSTPQELYYTTLEKEDMKRSLMNDARRLGKLLATESAEHQDDIIGCIGIEHLLSAEKARKAMEHRQNHARVVLEAQRRGYHADDIAMLSQGFSRSARERAAKLAVAYASML